jgi:menaquinone-9 beta-reductase
VEALAYRGDRIVGVDARTRDGTTERFSGRLVVGADGYRSKTAELAGVPERRHDNARFFVYAYYRGMTLRQPGDASIWWYGRDFAAVCPTDGGLTEVALMPTKDKRDIFDQDRPRALERYVAGLPGAPDMTGAQRVGKVVTSVDYPLIRRHPVPAAGLALIGDAALTSDPTPAPGCTYALLSGRWLAETTSAALAGHASLEAGLRAYRRRHRFIERHDRLIRAEASAPPPNPVQRALREAAIQDPVTATRLANFGVQAAPVSSLLNPVTIGRACWVIRSTRRTESRAREVTRGAGADENARAVAGGAATPTRDPSRRRT